MLNWLNSEKLKDQRQLEKEKLKIIKEVKVMKKEDLFPKPVKLSLWRKIKILLLGS
jgi:hypothetical protein